MLRLRSWAQAELIKLLQLLARRVNLRLLTRASSALHHVVICTINIVCRSGLMNRGKFLVHFSIRVCQFVSFQLRPFTNFDFRRKSCPNCRKIVSKGMIKLYPNFSQDAGDGRGSRQSFGSVAATAGSGARAAPNSNCQNRACMDLSQIHQTLM